jgi:hypothetical protein
LRQLLRPRDFDDDFAGASQAEFIAGDFFNFAGIGLQFADFLLELLVFLVQLIEIRGDFPDFLLFAAHGQEAMGAENVVHNQNKNEQSEERAPMVPQKRFYFLTQIHFL